MTDLPEGEIRFPAKIAIDLEALRKGNGRLDPRTQVLCDVGVMLYWISSELWRIGEYLEKLVGEIDEIPVQDEAPTVPSEGTEESADTGETRPVDADEEREE
jgi:hypothetical protein